MAEEEETEKAAVEDVALRFIGGKEHLVDGMQTSDVSLAEAKQYERGGWDIASVLRTESFEAGPTCLEEWLTPPTEASEETVKE